MKMHETAKMRESAGKRRNRNPYCRVRTSTDSSHSQVPRHDSGLDQLVNELCRPSSHGSAGGVWKHNALPSRDALVTIMETLRGVLFPGYFGPPDLKPESLRFHIGANLDHVSGMIEDQVLRGLCFECGRGLDDCRECTGRAREITRDFLQRLPEVKRMLETDVRANYEGDPAANSPDEAVFCYPGIAAITSYRLAHELWKLEVPLIPRMITEQAHSITGIDIHPGAKIGESFFIDHGTGVVIGETCIIGKHVRVYQGVTLGARSFPLDDNGRPIKGIERHPIIEDRVVIYSGATLLGRIVIGRNSVIGGNVWLTRSVAPDSRVTQSKAREETFYKGSGI